jgi:NADPH:quinone reductase-like Zn-dependent oxidoreductase
MNAGTMKAIGALRYGSPEVLTEVEVPVPDVGTRQVLVRVAAAGLNPADAAIRQGQFRLFSRRPFPLVLGSDIAGTVHELGAGATRFQVGDQVHGLMPLLETGAYAEFAVIDEASLAPVPPRLTLVEAAAVPLAALSAYQGLIDRGGMTAGQRVLITGASGGVGTFAVQIARTAGCQVVTLTSARNVELMRSLGAEECLDYEQDGVLDRIGQVDIAFDCARSLPLARALSLLRPGGTYVAVVPLPNPVGMLRAAVRGRRFRWLKVQPDGSALQRIDDWISDGRLTPVIEAVYPPQEVAEAHVRLESRRVRGKLVLDMRQHHISPTTG